MTWGSFLTKALSLVIVLPLILSRFSTQEIALWYLFMIFISFQILADVGFAPTFGRVIAYAMGGADVDDLKSPKEKNNGQANWQTIELICSTMRVIYNRLSLLWTICLMVFGSIALLKPASLMDNSSSVWISWGIILVVSTVTLRGNIYNSYLQGINEIALLRRWEAITAMGNIVTSSLVLISGAGLLSLVIVNQGWQVLNIIINRWLSGYVKNGRFRGFTQGKMSKKVLSAVWPSAWRSGLGIFSTYGLVQASGILYAQVGSAAGIASYLLALRLIQAVSQFSQAPFYSKLPVFARLFAEDKKNELMFRARSGMQLSFWCYVLGFMGLSIAGEPLLQLIGSNADFPKHFLWSLMGLAFFVERYGAMHLQLYSITNQIIWHQVAVGFGVIYISACLIFFNLIGVYAFPVGILMGHLGFYSWFSAKHAYKYFNLTFKSFDLKTAVLPLVLMILYITIFFKVYGESP